MSGKFEIDLHKKPKNLNIFSWISIANPITWFHPNFVQKILECFLCSFKTTKSWFLFSCFFLDKIVWLEFIGYLLQKWMRKKTFLKCFFFMFQSLYFERKFFKTSLPKESMNGLDIHEATVVAMHNNFIVIACLENHM